MARATLERELSGGDPRSLGRADDVVRRVLARPARVSELFECVLGADEIVRMRAADALEKVCREKPALLQTFKRRLFTEVAAIDQPSVQWHLAQMLARIELTAAERARAIRLLESNLARYDDWIVVNLTLEALAKFARDDASFRDRFVRIVARHVGSRHKSVASRARRLLDELAAARRAALRRP
jgi:hypothetical protein